METFTIKTHKPTTTYNQPHLFILSRGLNSGKPLTGDCPNCFVVLFTCDQEFENHYWLALSLWQSGFWHQFLIGSVIPFIRIDEFKNHFSAKSKKMRSQLAQHQKQIAALRMLQAQEHQCQKTLKIISDLRKLALATYL